MSLTLTGNCDFLFPHAIVRCRDGSFYVSDQNNNRIKKLIPQKDGSYEVKTVAGSQRFGVLDPSEYQDGPANVAQLNFVGALALDDKENLYIADACNNKIRILSNDGIVSTFTPLIEQNGVLQEVDIHYCRSLALDRNSAHLYFFDNTSNLFKIHIATRKCVAKTRVDVDCSSPRGILVDTDGNVYFSGHSNLFKLDKNLQSPFKLLENKKLRGLLMDTYGRYLYIGTNDGIDRLSLATDKLTNIFTHNDCWVTGMAFERNGYVIVCQYVLSKLERIKIGEHLPWISFKLMWLGFMKNDPHSCPIARLPRDLIRVILQYCYE